MIQANNCDLLPGKPQIRMNARIARYYPALEALVSAKGRHQSSMTPATRDNFGAALRNLQRGLTGDRALVGVSYFSEADYLGAYLLYYWPVSFVQASLALEEIRMRGALPVLRKVLDIGAGPGPASFAAAEYGAERVTLLDFSVEALDAAIRLRGSLPWIGAEFSARSRNLEKDDTIEEGPFDLIIACHSANELWKGRDDAIGRRASLFEKACSQLSAGGVLLVIEPSATITGRPALALRDLLLERVAKEGMRCVAPCPGSHPCPIASAGEGRSCHSTWPWEPEGPVAAMARTAGLDRDSAKATWFALKKDGEAGESSAAKAGAGQDPPEDGRLAGRIVSEPMLNKGGRVRYILCTTSGLATLSAKAGDTQAKAAGFFSLGRGDCIEARGMEKRSTGNNFGLTSGTKLEIRLKAPEA